MNFIDELSSAKKEIKGCYWKMFGIGALFALIMFVSCVTVVGPLIIFGPMYLGFHRAILELVRTRKVKVSTLFSGFKDFGVAFRAGWLWGIKIFLWSLLLIVPGIIAAIRYSMAFFILADNPDITAREAIDISKEMMDGRKGEFFKTFILYFGFFCLINIISGIFGTENYSNGMSFVSYILSAIALAYGVFVVPLWNLMLPGKFYNEKLEIAKDSEQTGNVGKFIGIFLLYCLLMVILGITIVGAIFMAAPLTLGFSKVILDYSRDNEVKVSTLFSGLKNYKRAFCLGVLMFLKVFLWSLLLIVPGIIAAIKYSMSYFILADNPKITATEAIEKSKEMMKGKKMDFVMYYIEYFLLYDISLAVSNFIFKFANNREILFLYVISAVIYVGTLIYYLVISPDYSSILVERFYKDLSKEDCLENKNIEA